MGRMIPKRVLEDIRFRNDIVDVIGASLTLQRSGSAFKALCPFHKEKTPSFQVNPQRQIFHCFGCGAGGDVFGFVMQYEGMDFMGAAQMLAHRAGIVLELEDGAEGGSDKVVLYKVHEELAEFYHRCLLQMTSAEHARAYLADRDLGEDVIKEFMIGYAPNRWDTLLKWAAKRKHRPEHLELGGLIIPNTKPGARAAFYDRFRDRLMFPIRDEQKRTIAFSGRSLSKEANTAKYVNSPETPLFHKGRVLYALEKARRPIVESREAIVCEGQIDVIRCHAAGFTTAVASQGTAFSEDHARVVRRYADSVNIVFDSDKAGQDAAVRTAGIFMAAGLAVRIASLPAGEDPDSFIREQGADAFRRLLDESVSAVSFQIAVLSSREDAASEVGLMRISKEVLKTIAQSPNAVQRAALTQEAADCLGVPAAAIQDDLAHLRSRPRREAPKEAAPVARKSAKRPMEEMLLCEHLMHVSEEPELANLFETYLPLTMLADPTCRALASACLTAWREGRELQEVLDDLGDPTGELQKTAAAVLMAPPKLTGKESSRIGAVQDIILYLWRRRLDRERSGLAEDDPRKRQLTYDLKAAGKWSTGAEIIAFENEAVD